jgi:hypothetical protein
MHPMADWNHISPTRMSQIVTRNPPLGAPEWHHLESCDPCLAFAKEFVRLTGVIEGQDLSDVLHRPPEDAQQTKTA